MSSMKVRKGEKLCARCNSAVILNTRKYCSYCKDTIEAETIKKMAEKLQQDRLAREVDRIDTKNILDSISPVDFAVVFSYTTFVGKSLTPTRRYAVNLFTGEYDVVESHQFQTRYASLIFADLVKYVYDAKIDVWV